MLLGPMYFFSIQFRENLQIARRLYPDDAKLIQLEREESQTDNLSPWPEVAAVGERLDHDEFMSRLLLLSPPPEEKRFRFETSGNRYLRHIREIDPAARASGIASYEDGGLERVFRAMLKAAGSENPDRASSLPCLSLPVRLSYIRTESIGGRFPSRHQACSNAREPRQTIQSWREVPPRWRVPHSRYNELPTEALIDNGYQILSVSADSGTDIFMKRSNEISLYFQGHPEYDSGTLLLEYRRDIKRFLLGKRDTYPAMPRNYFDPAATAVLLEFRRRAVQERDIRLLYEFPTIARPDELALSWREPAIQLFSNWLTYLAERRSDAAPAAADQKRLGHKTIPCRPPRSRMTLHRADRAAVLIPICCGGDRPDAGAVAWGMQNEAGLAAPITFTTPVAAGPVIRIGGRRSGRRRYDPRQIHLGPLQAGCRRRFGVTPRHTTDHRGKRPAEQRRPDHADERNLADPIQSGIEPRARRQ